MSDQDLIDLQEVAPAEVGEIDLYQRREKIYTRKIEGFYQRLRLYHRLATADRLPPACPG